MFNAFELVFNHIGMNSNGDYRFDDFMVIIRN